VEEGSHSGDSSQQAPAVADKADAPAGETVPEPDQAPAAAADIPLRQDPPAPVEEVPAPVEEVHAPIEEVHAPVEEGRASVEEMHAPVEEGHGPIEEVHAPAPPAEADAADAGAVDAKPVVLEAETEPEARAPAHGDLATGHRVLDAPEGEPGTGPPSAADALSHDLWHDESADAHAEPVAAEAAHSDADAIAPPPSIEERESGEAAQPIPEELIWSGPETAEPAAPAPGHDLLAPASAPAAADAGAPAAPALSLALEHGATEPDPPPAAPLPPALRPWPSLPPAATLPGRDSIAGALPYVRLALRGAGMLAVGLAGTVLVLIVLYRWVDPPTSTLMLAQRLGGTSIEQQWLPLARMSPHLVQAVILSEDGSFCRHRGVDWSAVEEAIESSWDGEARGGSTITMQVVKNLFLWPSRSYVRKAIEMALAYLVEAVWNKQRVLEIYLNVAEWGPGVFGAEAAARHHFGKSATRLTAQEAALLAVALPNPIERQAGDPGPGVRRLAQRLLTRMRSVRTTVGCVRVRQAGG
jgi:monofunctional biosynthetic peptidoglycan transglycosylase